MHEEITDRLSVALDKISPQTIYMGYHTDPYQPCEAEYLQTRKVLELLAEKGFSASILTKSDLVVRDIDILKDMENANVSVSVAFNNNTTRRLFEANTMDTEKRVEALRLCKEAGVSTGALLCPVVPYITDTLALVDVLAPHADRIWIYGLSITDRSGPSWLNVQEILSNRFPDLMERIEPAIFSREHAFWTRLREGLVALTENRKLDLRIHV
jgi:DNA repair photolyase